LRDDDAEDLTAGAADHDEVRRIVLRLRFAEIQWIGSRIRRGDDGAAVGCHLLRHVIQRGDAFGAGNVFHHDGRRAWQILFQKLASQPAISIGPTARSGTDDQRDLPGNAAPLRVNRGARQQQS